MKFEFSGQIFEKNNQISNLMKIRHAGAGMFHADGDEMTILIITFHNFANSAQKKY